MPLNEKANAHSSAAHPPLMSAQSTANARLERWRGTGLITAIGADGAKLLSAPRLTANYTNAARALIAGNSGSWAAILPEKANGLLGFPTEKQTRFVFEVTFILAKK